MKRIVVTGAKGGAGTSIAAVLAAAGYEILKLDVAPMLEYEKNYYCVDVRDADKLNDIFHGADGLVHFGSPPGDFGFSTTEAFHIHTVGGFNVFQAARNAGIKRIAWASSIEVYGDFRRYPTLPVTEESPLAPPGIYATSKLLLERLTADFCRWYGLSIAAFRLSRIIYDNPAGRSKLHSVAYEEGEARGWDCLWSYVDARDVARACQAWLEADVQGAQVFNIAAADTHSETPTAKLLQTHGYAHARVDGGCGEFATLFSSQKLRRMLGWEEQYGWKQILAGA